MKYFYNFLALFFFGLGAIGAFLPVLPTVPFLLLASYFFAKGSERFNNWFINTSIYKNNLEDFIEKHEMTLQRKLSILLPVSTLLLFIFFKSDNLHVRIAIVFAIIFKYCYFIFRIKTVKKVETSSESI